MTVQNPAWTDAFLRSVWMMQQLREKCPWDKKQTPQTLKRYVLEEAYEVCEAIDQEDWDGLKDELGDFYFQVLFQAIIQEENNQFDLKDVMENLNEKMIRRHPHVFQESYQNISADQVKKNWESIKKEERESESLYDGFNHHLPALMAAYKIGKKAKTADFDWPDPNQVLEKVHEEIQEVQEAMVHDDPEHLEEELGDLLFVVANLVRKCGFEPEETLQKANKKFIQRYQAMESLAESRQESFHDLSLQEKERYWTEIKKK